MPPRRGPRSAEKPSAALEVLSDTELALMETDDKRVEAFHLWSKRHTQVEIARRFGVTRVTVQKWLASEVVNRRNRREDVEAELERIYGTIEAVITEAFVAYRKADEDQLSAPNFLRLALDGAKELARLQGLDKAIAAGAESAGRRTEVRLIIGGDAGQKAMGLEVVTT